MCEYYENNAKRYVAETISADMSKQYQRFLPLLKEKARILDVGSGSGRVRHFSICKKKKCFGFLKKSIY